MQFSSAIVNHKYSLCRFQYSSILYDSCDDESAPAELAKIIARMEIFILSVRLRVHTCEGRRFLSKSSEMNYARTNKWAKWLFKKVVELTLEAT